MFGRKGHMKSCQFTFVTAGDKLIDVGFIKEIL
jgi:hypothetical protein